MKHWPHGASERGSSLVEFLVSSAIIIVTMLALMSAFNATSQRTNDETIKMRTDNEARTLLDFFIYDIRMAGAGMPLGQSNFAVGQSGLGDAPLPVLVSATNQYIQIRLNQTGTNTVLTSDFMPSPTSLSFSVFSTNDLSIGATVYIGDRTVGGTTGFTGVISGIAGSVVTTLSSARYPVGVTLRSGSLVNRVSTVSYRNGSGTTGIIRNDEAGDLVLQPRSSFSLTYYDRSKSELTVPLAQTIIRDDLSSMNVRVSVTSEDLLKDGSRYTATASQDVGLRNLILSR